MYMPEYYEEIDKDSKKVYLEFRLRSIELMRCYYFREIDYTQELLRDLQEQEMLLRYEIEELENG